MASKRLHAVCVVSLLCGTAGSALAFSSGMRPVATDPSTWGFATNIASLDSASTGFNFTETPPSGFSWSFLGTEQDRTQVVTDVYRVTSPHTFDPGGPLEFTLNTNDLVFAYRITMVEVNALTVTSLREAQVAGAPAFGFGQDVMLASMLNAQGYVSPAHGRVPVSGNVSDAGGFGSTLDFEWGGGLAQNLLNDQSITLLMFTAPGTVGQGVLNLIAPPGQINGIIGQANGSEAPPILIPVVPAPGSIALLTLGVGVIAARRRVR